MVNLVVAAAGYGKTTALRHRHATWHAGLIGLDHLADKGPIVIDDLPKLLPEQALCLLEQLEQLPPDADVTIASRHPLPVSTARLRGRGLLTETRPADLALTVDETAELLANDYGIRDPDLSDQVHDATAGWPALVRLTGEALAAGEPLLPKPGSPLWTYLHEEVLAGMPALLSDIAELDPVTVGLAEALGHRDAAESVPLLRRSGLLVNERLVPMIAHVLEQRPARHVARLAALWYHENGPPVAALRAFALAGHTDHCGQLLDQEGEAILSAGHGALVTEVLSSFPTRSRRQQLLLGDAMRTAGSVLNAAQAYAVVADAETTWDAGLAWRMGLIHYLRGDSHAALKAFARAKEGIQPSADEALLLAWRACAHLQLGETATAVELANLACRKASAAGDDAALATAYVSSALCQSVSGRTTDSEELYAQALMLAEQVGSVVLRARILTSRTYQLLVDAKYAAGLEAARQTAQCALAAGHTNLRAIALSNEGDALRMLGRYDEAIRQYERAQALCLRMGSRRSAAAEHGLAEVYRRRGWTEQARAAYETAIQVAEEIGLHQIRVWSLAGLARVLSTSDTEEAAALADQAMRLASDRSMIDALLARGWVCLHSGDKATGAEMATDAAKKARADRDPASLAEALELRAATETDLVRARAALREALAIWQGAGAIVEAARLQHKLGQLPNAGTDDRIGALLAAETLAGVGIPVAHAEGSVMVKAFGRFEVCLDGQPVPATQWQSRKARDLLRILVARRGRPVPRGELCELLWPDDDPARTGHRLSVLLSIIKGVLDPNRTLPPDHYLLADQAGIGLDVTRLRVDVEEFLADVVHGRRLRERGALDEAERLLSNAVQGYRADVYEDEPYAEWSVALREEARAGYVSALRTLAYASRKLGKSSAAVSYLLRLLSIDPYDEAGHRALIETLAAGGQHGEARRANTRYREAMRAIGVKPAA